VPPKKDAKYADKIFTTGAAGYPVSKHFPDREEGERKDFSASFVVIPCFIYNR